MTDPYDMATFLGSQEEPHEGEFVHCPSCGSVMTKETHDRLTHKFLQEECICGESSIENFQPGIGEVDDGNES